MVCLCKKQRSFFNQAASPVNRKPAAALSWAGLFLKGIQKGRFDYNVQVYKSTP
jgi:hypothetical protein